MRLGRVMAVAKKDWKKTVRDPAVLFMIILFPLVMTVAFGASFGAVGGTSSPSYAVAVVDLGTGGNATYARQFSSALAATGVVKVQSYSSNASAQSALSQGRLQGVLVLPASFDASVQSFKSHPADPSRWVNSTVQLYLDKGSILSSQVVPTIVGQVFDAAVLGLETTARATPVTISNPALVLATGTTVFDSFAPGLFAFASIYLIIMVAGSFTSDRESGMLNRIVVTPATSSDVMLGSAVSYLLIGLAQVLLVLGSAYALGFHPDTGAAGLLVGVVIATVFALCNVGFGLITASIAKSASAATGVSFLFLLPQLFLGTFVGSALGSAAQTAGRFVPAWYVTDALTSLFSRGASATSPAVLTDLLAVSVSSVVILAAGVLLFKRRSRI
jgi:ABC-type Na+ efflux pump permease subunit